MKFISVLIKRVSKNPHFKNFKDFFIGGVIAILIGYLGNYLINKNLSRENLGQFSYYYNLMTLLTGLVSLNIFQAYLRFNNDVKIRNLLKSIVLKFSIITSIFLFIISYLIFQNFYIASFSFLILFNERIYFFRSLKQILKMNILKYTSSIILIICLLSFVSFTKLTFEKALLSYGIGYFIVFLFGLLLDRKGEDLYKTETENNLDLKYILKYTTPIALSTVVTWILSVSDQVILKEFVSLTNLGNFAIGYRIIVVIRIFTSLFLLYYPMLYFEEADKNNYGTINKIRFLFILILFIVTVTLIVFRKYIYILMGANQYLDFTHIFILLAIAEFLRIISGLFLTFRAYKLQTWYSTIAVGISAGISVILNLIFIPKFGIIAAAYVQVAASSIYLLITFFLAVKPETIYFKHAVKIN